MSESGHMAAGLHSRPPIGATVAICTYNGATRIGQVLEGLVPQAAPADQWEVLVVDNASTDGTAEVCRPWTGRLTVPLRVVREETPGLSHARRRAAAEASGEILCFLDDDNLPDPGWVAAAVKFFREHPRAGSVGGKVLPVWESEPSALALAVCDFSLAICDRGENAFAYEGLSGPVGAGMCVRRDLLRSIYADPRVAGAVTGRCGSAPLGGEDLAISAMAKQAGYECWYAPALRIRHLIPASRMQFKYLLRLYEGIGRGQASVRRIYDWKARSPLLAGLIGAKDLGRWLRGCLLGPSGKLSASSPELRRQLHALQQRQLWGRAWQAITPRPRNRGLPA